MLLINNKVNMFFAEFFVDLCDNFEDFVFNAYILKRTLELISND